MGRKPPGWPVNSDKMGSLKKWLIKSIHLASFYLWLCQRRKYKSRTQTSPSTENARQLQYLFDCSFISFLLLRALIFSSSYSSSSELQFLSLLSHLHSVVKTKKLYVGLEIYNSPSEDTFLFYWSRKPPRSSLAFLLPFPHMTPEGTISPKKHEL